MSIYSKMLQGGIRNHLASDGIRQRLDETKHNKSNFDALSAKTEAKISSLDERLQKVENSSVDYSLADKVNQISEFLFHETTGHVNDVKQSFEDMRAEYSDLINSYVENSTPRLDRGKISELEQRLEKIEKEQSNKPRLVIKKN